MPIQVGDRVPSATFKQLTANGVATIVTATLLKGKKAVLFGLPGAYTPVCSAYHLPGFVAKADDLKAKGVDAIACISVNDPFVMQTWGKEHKGLIRSPRFLAKANGYTKCGPYLPPLRSLRPCWTGFLSILRLLRPWLHLKYVNGILWINRVFPQSASNR